MAQHLMKFLPIHLANDIMTDGRSKNLGFERRRRLQVILHDRPANGSEGIAVVKGKRSDVVDLMTDVESLANAHLPIHGWLPNAPRGIIAPGIV